MDSEKPYAFFVRGYSSQNFSKIWNSSIQFWQLLKDGVV